MEMQHQSVQPRAEPYYPQGNFDETREVIPESSSLHASIQAQEWHEQMDMLDRNQKFDALILDIERTTGKKVAIFGDKNDAVGWRYACAEYLIDAISVGSIPLHVLMRHEEVLAEFNTVQKLALFTAHYPQLVLPVLAQMPKTGENVGERFSAAEKLVHAHPSYLHHLTTAGFTIVECEALVARAEKNSPVVAYAMREYLGIPYEANELEELVFEQIETYAKTDGETRKNAAVHASAYVRLASWSTDQVNTFLKQYNLNQSEWLQRLQGIPMWEGAKSWREAQGLLRGRESEEQIDEAYERQMDVFETRAEGLSQEVYRVLVRVQSERRSKIDQDRLTMSKMHNGAVVLVDTVGSQSATSPLRLMIDGVDLPVVYKTPQREPRQIRELHSTRECELLERQGRNLSRPVREGIPAGEAFKREWLCKLVDTILGLDLVPATVLRRGPEGVGSVQSWAGGYIAQQVLWKERISEVDCIRLAVFDFLVQHCDRHSGNFLVSPEGMPIAIDNGYSFSVAPPMETSHHHQLRSIPSKQVENKPIPLELRRSLRKAIETPALEDILKRAFTMVFAEHSARMFSEFVTRINIVAPKDEQRTSNVQPTVWI